MARADRELLADADALNPVPLHWRRQWTRRFNQSVALVGAISALCKAQGTDGAQTCASHAATGRQSKIERADNVQGAFRVPSEHKAHLVLVDDVLTSGATVDVCARALLRAGAAYFDVVFARVVAPARTPI